MSDNEEEISNNDSILNSVKTEPSDILNESMEHHRNSFPILGLPGNFIQIDYYFLPLFLASYRRSLRFRARFEPVLISCLEFANPARQSSDYDRN